MESSQDKINRLKAEIAAEESKQRNCRHNYDKSVFAAPFKKAFVEKEEYLTGEYEHHGVDHWPKTAWRDKTVYKWVRKCTLCGYEQVTRQPVFRPLTCLSCLDLTPYNKYFVGATLDFLSPNYETLLLA